MANQIEKLFTVAGTATDINGVTKARFANDLVSRIKILNKAGCTDINLVELPEAMTKVAALRYLATLEAYDAASSEAIASKLADKTREVKRKVTAENVLEAIAKRPKIGSEAKTEEPLGV